LRGPPEGVGGGAGCIRRPATRLPERAARSVALKGEFYVNVRTGQDVPRIGAADGVPSAFDITPSPSFSAAFHASPWERAWAFPLCMEVAITSATKASLNASMSCTVIFS